jgi:hypothetical protein
MVEKKEGVYVFRNVFLVGNADVGGYMSTNVRQSKVSVVLADVDVYSLMCLVQVSSFCCLYDWMWISCANIL